MTPRPEWPRSDHCGHSWSVSLMIITGRRALDRVQTHAGHSIAINMFLYFVTLWPWTLTFWPKTIPLAGISQDHFLNQVWRLWDHSFLSYATDERHTHYRHTDADERFTPAAIGGVSNKWTFDCMGRVACNFSIIRAYHFVFQKTVTESGTVTLRISRCIYVIFLW